MRLALDPMEVINYVIEMQKHFGLDQSKYRPAHQAIIDCLNEKYIQWEKTNKEWDNLHKLIDLLIFTCGFLADRQPYIELDIIELFHIINKSLPATSSIDSYNSIYLFVQLNEICEAKNPLNELIDPFFKQQDIGSKIPYLIIQLDKTGNIIYLAKLIYTIYAFIYNGNYGSIFKDAFLEVHNANMKKQVELNGLEFILIKPEGWQPPDLKKFFQTKSIVTKALEDRESQYGPFVENARITSEIMAVMQSGKTWEQQPNTSKEAMRMIAHKIARIVNGNPFYEDNFLDIAGYAELARMEILKCPQINYERKLIRKTMLYMG